MKIILYIAVSAGLSLNSCNENNQSKTISENKSTTILADTSAKDVVSKNEKEISADTNSVPDKKTISEKRQEYFKLLSATSQSWTAGIPSGGSGTEYYFKLKITSADNLKFDTAWINNRKFEIFISKETAAVSSQPIKFAIGDIITLRVSDIRNQNIKTENLKPPLNFEGAALVAYRANDKQNYFIIKEIKKQSSPNRP